MTTNTIKNKTGKIICTNVRLAGKIKEIVFDNLIEPKKSIGSNYNGYGYSDWEHIYIINRSGIIEFNKFINNKKQKELDKPSKTVSAEEKKIIWCKRLAKLSNVSFDVAMQIANEKAEYKEMKIEEVRKKQYERYSVQREKLINKMERENPLRKIKDKDHARAIIIASDRHNNTNYENLLQQGGELAQMGEIDKSEVKEYARKYFK